MILFPAIDIKDGKVVRLLRGEFDKVTQYGQDPVAMAKHWEAQGAQWLHVVDLDGAQTGEMKNFDHIHAIIKAIKIPVQVGGGIRTLETVRKLIDAGAGRVVLGTKAVQDLTFLKGLLAVWPERIAVSLDCKEGYVTTLGWVKSTTIKVVELARDLEAIGLRYLIYTDVATDGMMTGPNLTGLRELMGETQVNVIASGGISSLEDLKSLVDLERLGLIGAITGKAIYENKFTICEALKLFG